MKNSEIALLFENARKSKKMTQKDVADALNYSSQNISLWESGKVSPKMDLVFEFCNAVKMDPISFLSGKFKDSECSNKFAQDEFLHFLKLRIADENVSKQQLEQWLAVSRPTLNRILAGENVISIAQYYAICENLNFDYSDIMAGYPSLPLPSSSVLPEEEKKRRFPRFALVSLGVFLLLGVGIGTGLLLSKTNLFSTNPADVALSYEDTPEIQIDYAKHALQGFETGFSYTINGYSFSNLNFELPIHEKWYDKEINIVKLARDENYMDSSSQSLFVDTTKFENFLDVNSTSIKNSAADLSDLDTRLKNVDHLDEELSLFSEVHVDELGIIEDNSANYLLNENEKEVLSKNLQKPLSFYGNQFYTNWLMGSETFFLDSSTYPSYIIKSENGKSYVEITGTQTKTQSSVYIPSEIDDIDDIRVADYAFEESKNPNLQTIVFQRKPSYLGDYAFSGLSLGVLDFGYSDDARPMAVKITKDEESEVGKYSNAFANLVHVDRCRLPFYIGSSDVSLYFSGLFGKNSSDYLKSDAFGGISAFFIPSPENLTKMPMYDFVKVRLLKISSLYVPKNVRFQSNISEKNVDLRILSFQQDEDEKNEITGNFTCFYALEYLSANERLLKKTTSSMFLGCISMKGALSYQNLQTISTESFSCMRMPSKIELRNVTSIGEKAFYAPYGLNQIDIYKSDEISSSSPLVISSSAFVNNGNLSGDKKIQKIVFHGFSEDELCLATDFKGENITVEKVA